MKYNLSRFSFQNVCLVSYLRVLCLTAHGSFPPVSSPTPHKELTFLYKVGDIGWGLWCVFYPFFHACGCPFLPYHLLWRWSFLNWIALFEAGDNVLLVPVCPLPTNNAVLITETSE